MVMMDSGKGSSKARVGVFFLSAGFALTAMFENICVSFGALSRRPLFKLIFAEGNAVAGGIDLAGLFPRYIDIRRVCDIFNHQRQCTHTNPREPSLHS